METIKGFDEKFDGIKHPRQDEKWSTWLNKKHLNEEAIAWLQKFAYYLAKKGGESNKDPLTASQLRKFFGAIKKIHIQILSRLTQQAAPTPTAQEKKEQTTPAVNDSNTESNKNDKKIELAPVPIDRDELIGIIPQLAYAVARDEGKTKLKDFAEWVKNRLQQISNLQQFTNFIKAMEAIVAYHKYYEEKKS
ncbi:MAG: type III-A CRISPR-associated protein Csm2 [Bacteroidia bacterium]|nr:type III-A CRISPR-associated protein Csm2 [Bacteroidia bacterium]MDW8159465.1 type III-A CRISPR-associated protein Csm2 [Bacteroidia bacterium]